MIKSGMESKIWLVTLRSKSTPHRVEAATLKDEGNQLVFRDEQGNVAGSFNRADVMGYSVEPEMPEFHVG